MKDGSYQGATSVVPLSRLFINPRADFSPRSRDH